MSNETIYTEMAKAIQDKINEKNKRNNFQLRKSF